MNQSDPVAFLSYTRADDEHDRGRITALRSRLEGEVRMHTGKPFRIFQDKRDLTWGQQWKERLDSTLLSVTFLIPIITPSYFFSAPCRDEFEKFLFREKQLGENRLILPIYYLDADQIVESNKSDIDEIAKVIASRNWADWRGLRFRELTSADVEMAISDMARTIKDAMKELESVIAASKVPPPVPLAPSIIQKSDPLVDSMNSTPGDSLESQEHKTFSPEPIPKEIDVGVYSDKITSKYYAFTKKYDEIILAEDLIDPEDTEKFQSLQKKLVKNLRRLGRTSIDYFTTNFDIKAVTSAPAVTILLDNSGSMRGTKISNTAAWACIISELLDEINISNEVLGFTTRAWKGGRSSEDWVETGKPKNPGRLNDLRHIIYKQFSELSKNVMSNYGLMAREGLLKENIDGEAILWTYNKEVPEGKDRRVIIVITDGAPVDDSTLLVNTSNFLSDHLISVLKWIEEPPNVKIFGVGVETDCSMYYSNNVTVTRSALIGGVILRNLQDWLR